MNCQEIDGLLLQSRINELSMDARRAVEAHIATCVQCRNNFYLTQLENEVLSETVAVPLLPPDFTSRTLQLLPRDLYPLKTTAAQKTTVAPIKPARRKRLLRIGTVAACLLLLAGGGLYLHNHLNGIFSGPVVSQNSTENAVVAETPADPAEGPLLRSLKLPEQAVTTGSGNADLSADALPVEAADYGAATVEESIEMEVPAATPVEVAAPAAAPAKAAPVYQTQAAKPAAAVYEAKKAPVVASNTVNTIAVAESEPLVNPYQYAAASPYTSSVADYTQTSRGGVPAIMNENTALKAKTETDIPKVVPSGFSDSYRLVDFSTQETCYTFAYEEDQHAYQLNFTVTPYDSNSTIDDIPDDSTVYRLISCQDITYQVTLDGTFSENDLTNILDQVKLQEL